MRVGVFTTMLLLASGVAAVGGFGEPCEVLVERLGDPRFDVREAATRELRDRGVVSIPACLRGTDHADPEVASRARRLLRRIEHHTPPTDGALEALTAMSESDDRAVAEFATRMADALRKDARESAAERRVQAVVRLVARHEPTVAECLKYSHANQEADRLETALAYALVAIRVQTALGGRGFDEDRPAKLWAGMEEFGFEPDRVDAWRREQTILSNCVALLEADVPDEAARLLRELPEEPQKRFHWDLKTNDVCLALLYHPHDELPEDPWVVRDGVHRLGDPSRAARLLLRQANVMLALDQFDEARRFARHAERCQLDPGPGWDSPKFTLASVNAAEKTHRHGERAKNLLKLARTRLDAGKLDEARALAKQVEAFGLDYGLFDDRPDFVLAEVERRAKAP